RPQIGGEDALARHPRGVNINQCLHGLGILPADEYPVGVVQVGDGRALGQELRVGQDVELHAVARVVQDALERLCGAHGQGRFLHHDLVIFGYRGDLPCAELDELQVGRHALALAVGLGGRVHRDEDHVGGGDGRIHVGGEEQVPPAGFGHHRVKPRLVYRQLGEVPVVPSRDAGSVDVNDRNGDVRAFLGNHRHGGAANVAGANAAYVFYCHRVSN